MKNVHVVLMSEWHVSNNVLVDVFVNKVDAQQEADKLNAKTCEDIHYTVKTKRVK